MKLFARHLIRWQWIVVALLVGVTGVALVGMTRLRVDPSNARLLPCQRHLPSSPLSRMRSRSRSAMPALSTTLKSTVAITCDGSV